VSWPSLDRTCRTRSAFCRSRRKSQPECGFSRGGRVRRRRLGYLRTVWSLSKASVAQVTVRVPAQRTTNERPHLVTVDRRLAGTVKSRHGAKYRTAPRALNGCHARLPSWSRPGQDRTSARAAPSTCLRRRESGLGASAACGVRSRSYYARAR